MSRGIRRRQAQLDRQAQFDRQLERRAPLRRLAADDTGLSLVELLVAVVIIGVVLTMVANLYIATVRSTDQAGEVHESTGNASNAANELGSVIRFATTNPRTGSTVPDPAILVARTDRIVLMATIGVDPAGEAGGRPPKPTLVEFQRQADGQLRERRWNPNPSGATWVFPGTDPTTQTPASTRLLGGTLAAGTPVFRYFTLDDGNAATNEELTPGATGLTAAQRALVARVNVTITMRPPGDPGAQPVVITQEIPLANLGLREPT
ncbi:PilW family protein [Agromyces sp. LHK192]|uniref:PilW family protein n=1 Tax=Agromyces sp. LHK192 TaxID=2498704 RepID=UPI0013E35F56|nr:prepilin-type N-terminal cleavage/methylation domain-containing protein [Agromyces sp. LHK192]